VQTFRISGKAHDYMIYTTALSGQLKCYGFAWPQCMHLYRAIAVAGKKKGISTNIYPIGSSFTPMERAEKRQTSHLHKTANFPRSLRPVLTVGKSKVKSEFLLFSFVHLLSAPGRLKTKNKTPQAPGRQRAKTTSDGV